MKAILAGIFATTFALASTAQVQQGTQSGSDQTTQSQSGNMNATARSGMDDYSWDPVYTQHMSDYERGLNSDYGLLMGQMSLTEDQKNQLKRISDNSRMQMMEMYRNTDLTNDQIRQQHMALAAERRRQISALLTADQRTQYDRWYTSNPGKMHDLKWRTEWANDNMTVDKMRSHLSLTDDQYAKLQKLDAGYTEKRMAIMNDNSLTADQRKEQMKALQMEKRTTYRALLNADQIAKIKVERDGDVKIKTKEGGETKKIKTKGGNPSKGTTPAGSNRNNDSGTNNGTNRTSSDLNSNNANTNGTGNSSTNGNSTGNQNMKSTTSPGSTSMDPSRSGSGTTGSGTTTSPQ